MNAILSILLSIAAFVVFLIAAAVVWLLIFGLARLFDGDSEIC